MARPLETGPPSAVAQGPPAVARAMAAALAHHLKVPTPFPKDFVSYTSVGDGSVNNAHWLAGGAPDAFA